MRHLIWTAASVAALLAGCTGAGTPDGPGPDGGRANDAGTAVADAPVEPDGGSDAGGPLNDCTARCLEAQERCGGTEIDCGRLCATYESDLVAGCETERDAYFGCGFGPTCMSCSAQEATLVACIVERSDAPCLTHCRAATTAGCPPGGSVGGDCNCIAQYYDPRADLCRAQMDTYYTCAAAHPCDRGRTDCAGEMAALNACALGCGSDEVGCYVGSTGRCMDRSALMSDGDNCGRCNNRCGGLGTCVAGACACAGGSHFCADVGCVADSDATACGPGCTVCSAPERGSPICDAGTCGFVCDAGYRAEGDLCVRDCPAGQHACGDICFSDDDPTHCGPACAFCTVPDNSSAICASGACDIACDMPYTRSGAMCVGSGSDACTAAGACDPFDPVSCGPGTACRPATGGTACQAVAASPIPEGGSCGAVADCEAGTYCLDYGDGFRCQRLCRRGSAGACDPDSACSGTISGGDSCINVCRPLPIRCNIYTQDCAEPTHACTLATNPETGEQYTGCRPAGSHLHGQACGGGSGSCARGLICVRDAGAAAATCHWVCGDARGPTYCRDSSEWCGGNVSGWEVLYCLPT